MQKSELCSGTISRGTLNRGTRATFHALCSNWIRLSRSAVYQERQVSQVLHSSPYLRYDESTSSRAVLRHVRRQIFMALDRFNSCRVLPHTNAITPLHSKHSVENWPRYVQFWKIHRHPTTSHIEASPENSLPQGRLGGEDGGSVWYAQLNVE